jgi:site-specific DNA-methyltransferase (adenine-specific)
MFKYEWVWDKIVKRGHLVSKIRPLQQTESVLIFGRGKIKYLPQEIKREKPMKMKEGSRTEIMGEKKSSNYRTIRTTFLPSNLIIFSNGGDKNKVHPTQKPVALFEYLIKTYTNEGDLVLDNCAGSFTTAIASENLKRNWICIEKEAEYCAIGEKRIKENRERLLNIDNCAKLDI